MMLNKSKQSYAIILAAALAFACFMFMGTLTAFAESVVDSGTSGSCTWKCVKVSDDHYRIILEGGENASTDDYTYFNKPPWYNYRDKVTEIALDEYSPVPEIGDYAFADFDKLTEVELYGMKRIGKHAFAQCTNLREITIYGVEEGCEIQDSAFIYCQPDIIEDAGSSSSISLRGVKTVGPYAFQGCNHESIYLGDQVEKIGDLAFSGNNAVRSINIPASCKQLNLDAFCECPNVRTATISNKDCEFNSGDYIFGSRINRTKALTLIGYAGSTTEAYAKAYDYKFAAIGSNGKFTIDLRSGTKTIPDSSWRYEAWRRTAWILNDGGEWETDYVDSLTYYDFDRDGHYDISVDQSSPGKTVIKKLPGTNIKLKHTTALPQSMKEALTSWNYPFYESLTILFDKADNPLSVKGKSATVKLKKLKKKNQTLAVTKVMTFKNKGKGTMKYTLSSAKKGKKSFKKYFKVNSKTGKVTIKKNKKMKKGTYTVKVKVKAAGDANYKPSAWITVTFKIKVK